MNEPLAAIVHGLSRQTAQVSLSLDETVEDGNPNSVEFVMK